jgi:hypothetical protein
MKSNFGEFDHSWRLVTNQARGLRCIAADPTRRLRDIAVAVGITERTAAESSTSSRRPAT